MKERGTTSVHAPPEHRLEDPGICTDQAVCDGPCWLPTSPDNSIMSHRVLVSPKAHKFMSWCGQEDEVKLGLCSDTDGQYQ